MSNNDFKSVICLHMKVTQKTKNGNTIHDPATPFQGIWPKELESGILNTSLHPHVHSHMYITEELEAQISINKWIDT